MTVQRFNPVATAAISLSEQGEYVKYADYEKLAAENAGLKASIPELRNVEFDNDSMDDVSLAEDFGFNDAIGRMKIKMSKTPATSAFLAEVRAQGVEMFLNRLQRFIAEGDFVGNEVGVISGAIDYGKEFAAQLRKGVQS